MGNYMQKAYDVASTEAHKAVRSVAHSVVVSLRERCPEAVTTDDCGSDERYEVIHECVDDALIYTSDAWLFAYGLPEQDLDDAGGMGGAESITDVISRQAYVNLQAEVMRLVEDAKDLAELEKELQELES